MQRIKESTSPSVFSSYFKIINHVHETWFSKHTFKRTRWFFRYVKFLINHRGRKLENCRKKKYGRKNLVTTIFFEQRVKEKLNTWFDYYIWECWLLCVCVFIFFDRECFFRLQNVQDILEPTDQQSCVVNISCVLSAKFHYLRIWNCHISPPKTKTPADSLLERKRYDIMHSTKRWYILIYDISRPNSYRQVTKRY